jgi:hypothetical protein
MISNSIILIMLITPAFLILICGLPTFHFIAIFNIFKYTRVACYFKAYLIWVFVNIYYNKTRVSILISISQSTEIQYSRTVKIEPKKRIAYP